MNPKDFYILVVDDEESICSILSETLESDGYNVQTVNSAEAALELLEHELPHIVMTDIRMPGISGVELAMRIKEISDEIEVIIMTSHASLDTATKAIKIGVYDYINKPFNNLNEVKNLILRVIEKIYLRFENKHLIQELQAKNQEILKTNEEIIAINEEIGLIYKFSKELSDILEPNEIINTYLKYLSSLFSENICFFLKYLSSKNSFALSNIFSTNLEKNNNLESKLNIGFQINPINISNIMKETATNVQIIDFIYKVFNTKSFISQSLIIKECPVGVFIILNIELLNEREKNLLKQFLNQIEISYDKSLLHQKLKELAIKDGLTSLFNRRYFQDKINLEFNRSRRFKHPLSLLFFDIDHFKNYNDINGHPMGDKLLKDISKLIKKSFRSSDVVCRYGGEEFCVIMPHTSIQGALIKAEKLRVLIEETPFINQKVQPGGNLTISIGVSEAPTHSSDPEKLLKLADDALYESKKTGRNKITIAKIPDDYIPSYEVKK